MLHVKDEIEPVMEIEGKAIMEKIILLATRIFLFTFSRNILCNYSTSISVIYVGSYEHIWKNCATKPFSLLLSFPCFYENPRTIYVAQLLFMTFL